MLVEKPLALTVEAGEQLCELAKRASLVLMVEMTHRFMPPVVEARDLIADGLIGNVLAVDDLLLENVGLFGSLPSWMFQRAQAGGGVGLTSGVHLLDHVSWLTGQKLSLESACFGYSQGMGEVEDTAAFFLRLENGAPVHIALSWRPGGPGMEGELRIFGEKGTLEVQPWKGWTLRGTDENKENVAFSSRLDHRRTCPCRHARGPERVRPCRRGGTRTRSPSGIGASQSEDHRTGVPNVPQLRRGSPEFRLEPATTGIPPRRWADSAPKLITRLGMWLQISRISPMRRSTSPSCVSCSAWSSKARQ